MTTKRNKLDYLGLSIEVFRSKIDGRIVVDIDTNDLQESDTFERNAVPKIRLVINEDEQNVTADGGWETFSLDESNTHS